MWLRDVSLGPYAVGHEIKTMQGNVTGSLSPYMEMSPSGCGKGVWGRVHELDDPQNSIYSCLKAMFQGLFL